MKLKQLRSLLESVASFEDPAVLLEQYVTPPNIAADFLYDFNLLHPFCDQIVVDLGCGTG